MNQENTKLSAVRKVPETIRFKHSELLRVKQFGKLF